jgi:tRNA(adenine34) deaminase
MTKDDERWMREAIALAKTKGTDPSDTPIAAIIVRDGKILAAETNRTAGANVGNMELRGATLYSTLQPCGMCTMASIWAKVARIVYGAGRDDVHRMYFEDRNLDTVDFIRDAYRDDLSIEGGCLSDECAGLYYGPNAHVPKTEQGNI